jgi:hypothetical protein
MKPNTDLKIDKIINNLAWKLYVDGSPISRKEAREELNG